MCVEVGRNPTNFEIIADYIEDNRTDTVRKILVRDRIACRTHHFIGLDASWVHALRANLKKLVD
jgi:hypothetical protein